MSIKDTGNHYSRFLAKEISRTLLSTTLLSYSFRKSRETFLSSNFAGNIPSVNNLPLLTNVETEQHQLRF